MKQGEKFTNERVRWIKQQLIAGVHPVSLARFLKVGANTIRRIRDGETYLGVPVPGEEGLRPGIGYSPILPEGDVGIVRPVAMSMVSTMTQEEIDAMEYRLLNHLPTPGKEKKVDEMSPELLAEGRKLAGL